MAGQIPEENCFMRLLRLRISRRLYYIPSFTTKSRTLSKCNSKRSAHVSSNNAILKSTSPPFAVEYIGKVSYDRAFCARPLKRYIEKKIVTVGKDASWRTSQG